MPYEVPQGFRFAGVNCGIKRRPGTLDLTLVVADRDAAAAGMYTTNLVCAAPVRLDRARTPAADMRVVVVNSGNANACTGERGEADAAEMARLAAAACGVDPRQVLVMSTGIIGEHLPMEKIAAGIEAAAAQLAADEEALVAAARGIITTDKAQKLASRRYRLEGREITITGMAKGAGMIGPKMATMLCVLMTDAPLAVADAQAALRAAVDQTFNCISVEGHMSTNDTALLLAGGAAGGAPLAGNELAQFTGKLVEVCTELARAIPADGEGASHLITIRVRGCRTRADARQIAETVANSALVKTAIAGCDPNWGRVVSAAGYAGVPFRPERLDMSLNGHLLYRQGSPVQFDSKAVSAAIRERFETEIVLQLAEGEAEATFYTSDLTYEYIRINAEYHT